MYDPPMDPYMWEEYHRRMAALAATRRAGGQTGVGHPTTTTTASTTTPTQQQPQQQPQPQPQPNTYQQGFNLSNNGGDRGGPATPTHQRRRREARRGRGGRGGPGNTNIFVFTGNGSGLGPSAPLTPAQRAQPSTYQHGLGNANFNNNGGVFGFNGPPITPAQQSFGFGGFGVGNTSANNSNNNGFGGNGNNINDAADRYEYILTSTHPINFRELPQANEFARNYDLQLQVYNEADITLGAPEEQPADATRYQYIIRSTRPVFHLSSNNMLRSGNEITFLDRYGAINGAIYPPLPPASSPLNTNQPLPSSPAAGDATTPAEAAPPGPVDPVQARGAPRQRRARPAAKKPTAKSTKGRKQASDAWVENAVIKPIWDTDSKGRKRLQEEGCAPTHYQCKLCPPSGSKGRKNNAKRRRTDQGVANDDDDDDDEEAEAEPKRPFVGRWGEQRRHFQSSREGHLEAWNEASNENQTRSVCTFPRVDPTTGLAERGEGGEVSTCGYTHGRADHADVDHMSSVHNAEAPGDPRAYSEDQAYLGRKRADCRRAIVRAELAALTGVRQRIRRLEEELAARHAGTDTPYVSVHGLDVQTDWSFDEDAADVETIVRLRRLGRATGRRQFRSVQPGTWHQVADDLEAGLHPGSRLAQALDFARRSQAGDGAGGHRPPRDYHASRPEQGDAGMVPLAPGQQPARRPRGAPPGMRRGVASRAEPKPPGKGERLEEEEEDKDEE